MTWPLEPEGARHFAEGLEEVIVVEEKRANLEDQLVSMLYNAPARPPPAGDRQVRRRPAASSCRATAS